MARGKSECPRCSGMVSTFTTQISTVTVHVLHGEPKPVLGVFSLWLGFVLVACLLNRSLTSGLATLSICFPSHIALLPEVALASAPAPMCSKIWEVCFDVNTVLDDPPINYGGATRSRHCSLLGGAARTRHDDAISGKRLTVPCDSGQSDPRWPRIATRSFGVFPYSATVLSIQCFQVGLASAQPGFLLNR